jgi:PAS domain S-box-containing protein
MNSKERSHDTKIFIRTATARIEPKGAISGSAMLTSSDPLARILDHAGDAIISINAAQRIILFNQCAQEIFGYSAAQADGQLLAVLLPGWSGELRTHPEESAASPVVGRMDASREIRGRRKNGTEFPAEASISHVQIDGRTMLTMILRDVTERVFNEQRLRASVRDAEELLKEIHHQVKNQLQVVSSLLGLQSRAVSEPAIHRMFQESQDRIHSMALLHESLYQSQNLSQVDFPKYIRQLAAHPFHSYGVAADRIHLRTDLGSLSLHLDAAVPCGLIINELVSNSLKYAFLDGRVGEIRIELREHSDGTARLVVADNGVGLKAHVDWINARSLGLRLVRTLAERLGAKIEVDSSAGTEVRLAFAVAA